MRYIPEDLVKPDYENSIVNLSSWILENFSFPHEYKALEIETGFTNVGLIVVDAFASYAWELIKKDCDLKRLVFFKNVTSVFPTTTTAALTSLFTARLPSEHGMLGYILFLKEFGFLTNMIELSPFGYRRDLLKDRMEFKLPVKTIFEKLKETDVNSYIILPGRYAKSGFSTMLNLGAEVVGYVEFGDFLEKFYDLMVGIEEPHLVVGYLPYADSVGHKENERSYLLQLKLLLGAIDKLLTRNFLKDSIVILTADHGMIRAPKDKCIWWDVNHPVMKFLDMPPGGERRMMHLYTRNPENLLNYLEENYGDKGIFLKKEEAYELFGGENERIGDVVLIAVEDFSFAFKYRFDEEHLSGLHGGLSYEEMYVPVFKTVWD